MAKFTRIHQVHHVRFQHVDPEEGYHPLVSELGFQLDFYSRLHIVVLWRNDLKVIGLARFHIHVSVSGS